MRYLFVGDPVSGRPILQAMEATGTIVAVAVDGDRHRDAAGRSTATLVATKDLDDWARAGRLRDLSLDLIVNFNSTMVFEDRLLSVARLAAINFHPGLLPGYAGVNVHQWAILNGEIETGVTLHEMVRRIDAGPILAQSRVSIVPTDTGLTLFMKLLRDGGRLMADLLVRIARDGAVIGTPQPAEPRVVYRRRDRPDGRLDFSLSAPRLVRLVNALSYRPMVSPLGVARVEGPSGEMEVAGAEALKDTTAPAGVVLALERDRLEIACADGAIRLSKAYLAGDRRPIGELAASVGIWVGGVL